MANTSENTPKKTPAKADEERREEKHEERTGQSEKPTEKPAERPRQKKPGPMRVLRAAREQISELTGMPAESVSSFEQIEDGWVLRVEVLELERVPDTMSLLASYEVQLDPDGELTGYRRVGRYERGRADKK
ncbi:gas vesicle protein [Streptomyces sp. NBC_00237]|uniref:gas vesicle protein GvpO n=1 Tax=Streptomyces sp. NBC_00237 TaxID=2975687 RepID=UPI00225A6162|nr:gas vesicle protein [Streptomyces sp. NBC_00237]MCX5203061.1 gas vesicle protein [Streptomyces sp. NBC_00237]